MELCPSPTASIFGSDQFTTECTDAFQFCTTCGHDAAHYINSSAASETCETIKW